MVYFSCGDVMTYDYKEEILEKLRDYHPVVHTKEEDGYDWLDSNHCSIEIQNQNGKSLFIDLEDEFTITYGDWHCHYMYEDRDDYEEVMEVLDDILHNRQCTLIIYSNGKWFGSGSSHHKENYTKEDAVQFINSFFPKKEYKEFFQDFQKYGVTIKICYWDEDKNYEFFIEKEYFL